MNEFQIRQTVEEVMAIHRRKAEEQDIEFFATFEDMD